MLIKPLSRTVCFLFILLFLTYSLGFPAIIFSPKQIQANSDPAQTEYMLSLGPINGVTTVSYVYLAIFNPAGSGRTAVVKQIKLKANAVGGATRQSLTMRRISASSGGTQVAAADIPKKNTTSTNSVLEIRTAPTVTLSGSANSRLATVVAPGAAGAVYSSQNIAFEGNEKLILQPGEGIALYQETAGDIDQRIRLTTEWEEQAAAPSSQDEYMLAYPRVEYAGNNYVYNGFFNPAASGKSAIVKRISIDVDADTTAVYTNNITIRRTSATAGGTVIAAADVPKKHTSTVNSVMDFRTHGPSTTLSDTVDSRLMMVSPPGAADQPGGHKEILFGSNDEKLIVQPGEGIALYTETAGDVDQIARMSIEWQEVSSASTPASQGEYLFSYPRVELAAVPDSKYHTFFNPAGSGKYAVVKRIEARLDADGAATYQPISVRRITAASGGTQINSSYVPKKHSATAYSVMDFRYNNVTATLAGTVDSRLLSITGQQGIGKLHSRKEIVFGNNEPLVLAPGEGIALYSEEAGDVDQYVKFSIEWDEEAPAPASAGEYMATIGPVNGSTTANYVYGSFFNPAASGKTTVVKRVWIAVDDIGASLLYTPFSLRRITAASGGTQVTGANIPKKNSSTADSIMDIRHTGPTATWVSGSTADSRLAGIQGPGYGGTSLAPQLGGHKEILFGSNDEKIVLQPGEGFALYQEAAGDISYRVKLLVEWDEEAATPSSAGEYALSIGPVNGSLTNGYVYATLFNPSGSSREYDIKKIEVAGDRIAAMTGPGYIPITARKITAASAGTQIAAADIPKKHTGTGATTAEIRHTNVTATFAGVTNSRLNGVTAPGAVGQEGNSEIKITTQDELILQPGEGIALYQETAAGDAYMRYRLNLIWSETVVGGNNTPTNDSLTFTNPYGGSGNQAVADDTTSWNFRALVTDADGPTNIDYIEIRFANSSDSTQPYDSLKYKWTESTDAFSEVADTQNAATITSVATDSNAAGNQWTIDFKVRFNNSFLAKDTQYAVELYTADDSAASDNDNYVDKYQVTATSLTLGVDSGSKAMGNITPGTPVTATTTTTVTTNFPSGYDLAASDGVAGTDSALLHTDASTRIADYAGTVAIPTSWTGTGLGISVYSATNKEAKWGTGTIEADGNNKYAGIPETSTVIHTKNGSPTTNDNSSVGYKLDVPSTQKTGTYSGSVTYSATGAL